jgi:hypothetical protein
MKKRNVLLCVLAALLVFSATTYAQFCSDVSGFISGNVMFSITDGCVIDKPVTIAGNVTIKSGGDVSPILNRGVCGPLITVAAGATLILENIIIDGNKNDVRFDSGSLVFVESAATLIIKNGAILQNNAASYGSSVFVENGGRLTMVGGTIRANQSHIGGGAVLVGNGSQFILSGGEISDNIADIGGGVFMKHGAEFYMYGGIIENNTARDFGGGVFVNDAGKFIQIDGGINSNTTNRVGGGVCVWGGTFTLNGGTICNNTAGEGDAVYVYESAVFNNKIGESCNNFGGDITGIESVFKVAIADLMPVRRAQISTFSAGPNPVAKSVGKVMFFYQGKQISKGEFTIINAAGKTVNKVRISDKAAPDNDVRRAVGEWNLKDRKGRIVADGAYLVRGTVVVNGQKGNVAIILGVK